MKAKTYGCKKCRKEKTVLQGGETPICCNSPMTLKLKGCAKPFDAETARSAAADEPCDDGTDKNE